MVISLYYYLKVVRALFMDKNETPIEPISTGASVKLGMIICAIGIVFTGLAGRLFDYIQSLIA
jgi:NADH-quinone oxidoreductase subunit N